MNCYNHKDREAITLCKECKRPICKSCATIGNKDKFSETCPSCILKYYQNKAFDYERTNIFGIIVSILYIVAFSAFFIAGILVLVNIKDPNFDFIVFLSCSGVACCFIYFELIKRNMLKKAQNRDKYSVEDTFSDSGHVSTSVENNTKVTDVVLYSIAMITGPFHIIGVLKSLNITIRGIKQWNSLIKEKTALYSNNNAKDLVTSFDTATDTRNEVFKEETDSYLTGVESILDENNNEVFKEESDSYLTDIEKIFDENNFDNIIFTNKDNEEIEFQQIATVSLDGDKYCILKMFKKLEESKPEDYIIYKLEYDENGDKVITLCTDQEIRSEVFDKYNRLFEEN